ncbi:MAG: hypothetical protein ACXVLQ_10060 [Bacteriovorax sp.]
MKVVLYLTLFVYYFVACQVQASSHGIAKNKNWAPKSTFFGVNQAWDYLPQEKTLLTFYAREKYRPFDLNNFPREKYQESLEKLRNLGLNFIGISHWKIEKMDVQKLGDQRLLVKIEGTYQREEGPVHFHEWQLFEDHIYNQVGLIEEIKEGHKYVSIDERESVFKEILGI